MKALILLGCPEAPSQTPMAVYASYKLKELGYSDKEISKLLSYTKPANTYVGLKDAELEITGKTKLEQIVLSYKRAGISKVVLKRGKGIRDFNERVIKQIREAGLQVIIGIDKGTEIKEIEKYIRMKKVNGFRVMEEGNKEIEGILKAIKESGKEMSNTDWGRMGKFYFKADDEDASRLVDYYFQKMRNMAKKEM